MEKLNYDPADFASHSLRAGLATSAAAAGKSERAIMNQTGHRFKKEVPPGDLIAVYALSGRPAVDFTAYRDKLQEAVSSLRCRPQAGHAGMQCPDVSLYIADLVIKSIRATLRLWPH